MGSSRKKRIDDAHPGGAVAHAQAVVHVFAVQGVATGLQRGSDDQTVVETDLVALGHGAGDAVRFGGREWRVVGIFEAGRSGFDSEIWGDADPLLQTFRRNAFSSMVFRLSDAADFPAAALVEARAKNKHQKLSQKIITKNIRFKI